MGPTSTVGKDYHHWFVGVIAVDRPDFVHFGVGDVGCGDDLEGEGSWIQCQDVKAARLCMQSFHNYLQTTRFL